MWEGSHETVWRVREKDGTCHIRWKDEHGRECRDEDEKRSRWIIHPFHNLSWYCSRQVKKISSPLYDLFSLHIQCELHIMWEVKRKRFSRSPCASDINTGMGERRERERKRKQRERKLRDSLARSLQTSVSMEIISRPTFIDRILGCSSSVHSSYCCSRVHGHRHLKVHNSPLLSHSYSILDVNLGLIIRYKGQGSCLEKKRGTRLEFGSRDSHSQIHPTTAEAKEEVAFWSKTSKGSNGTFYLSFFTTHSKSSLHRDSVINKPHHLLHHQVRRS